MKFPYVIAPDIAIHKAENGKYLYLSLKGKPHKQITTVAIITINPISALLIRARARIAYEMSIGNCANAWALVRIDTEQIL